MSPLRLFPLLLLLLCPLTTSARGQSTLDLSSFSSGLDGFGTKEEQTTGTLSTNTTGYAPGKTFQLTLSLKHPKGWHSYYKNPGSIGLVPNVKLTAPKGFTVKGPFWSIPDVGKIAADVYYGSPAPAFAWFITPTGEADGEATFSATGSWQLCGDSGCLPPSDDTTFTTTLSPNPHPEEKPAPVFPAAYENEASGPYAFSAEKKGSDYLLQIRRDSANAPAWEHAYFFSDTGEVLPTPAQTLTSTKDGYTLTLPVNEGKNSFYPIEKKTDRLIGMLTFQTGGKTSGLLLNLPLETAAASLPPAAPATANNTGTTHASPLAANTPAPEELPVSFLQILAGLFLGGLILNLMPCVFPVIGLKVMSFVQLGGGERRKVILHSLSFVIGVLISFWALTLLLVLLKQSVPNINWAFWLENPWIIFLLLMLMLALGLSMFGVFEIGVSATGVGGQAQQKKGYSGSFYSGVLATLVATPCSAPFLGAAIGPAMSLSSPLMFAAFTGMGLGMSLPYLLLGLFPGLVRYLPKPGAWMESFKQGLSFLLFGTAAWLLWTYWAFFPEHNPLASLTLLLGLIVFALAAWIKGRWDLPYKSARARWTGRVLCLLLALAGLYMASPLRISTPQETAKTADLHNTELLWEAWSPELQKKALEEGRPVYVDFTARWCATCQVNKSVAYTTPVRNILHKYNVLLLKADKTTSNPVIDAELRKLGRSAVPVNVLYIPGDATPYITTPLLSPGYLESFLLEHLSKTAKQPL